MASKKYFYLQQAAMFAEKARAAIGGDAQMHYAQLARVYRRMAGPEEAGEAENTAMDTMAENIVRNTKRL